MLRRFRCVQIFLEHILLSIYKVVVGHPLQRLKRLDRKPFFEDCTIF